ncbi:MAG: hypothetical protein ACTTJS_01590 [Wolinella sp.]
MKIDFKKFSKEPKKIAFSSQGCEIEGVVWKLDGNLYQLDATLHGEIELVCDLSGEEYTRTLNERLYFRVSDGLYNPKDDDEEFDVVEFFHGALDMDELLSSELESIRLDYHVKDAE